jgi:hypothetical protein
MATPRLSTRLGCELEQIPLSERQANTLMNARDNAYLPANVGFAATKIRAAT